MDSVTEVRQIEQQMTIPSTVRIQKPIIFEKLKQKRELKRELKGYGRKIG